ncbi:MAG TPA: hypothetical protein VHS31_18025 [Tepidisphaeraceae bacterium]|nr:hypothetical protein [Tepidisphaeraceae bacterium]
MLFLTLLLCGCASTPTEKSVLTQLSSTPNTTDLDFWHTLSSSPVATNDDAFHALLLYLDGTDSSTTYDERVATLKQRNLLSTNFTGAADQAIERGTLAVSLVKILDLKGGLTMRLFGVSPRYALRELEYRHIYPESSEQQLFSGAEFVGVIGRVEDFKEGDPASFPAKILYVGAEPVEPNETIESASDDAPKYPAFLSTAANLTLLDPATTEAASQPAAVKIPDGPLEIVITGVRGTAQFRIPPEEAWKKAEKGQPLTEGSELRTGIKSAVQLQIHPDQTITIDRLGVLKIDRATLSAGKIVASVSMPYGRTRYDIDAANREYDATVRSPNSTLGIRGTQVSLFDQRPFPPEAVSLTGTAQFQNLHRQLVALGKHGQGKTKITGNASSAAQLSLAEAVVDPTFSDARTQSEQPLVASLLSRGAVFDFNRDTGVPTVHGGTVPQTNAQLFPLLPGQLDFVARWSSDVNINLLVSTPGTAANPGGEVLFPAQGLLQTPSGGKLPFDHTGGPHGGIEIAHWDTASFPTGIYGIFGNNESNKTARVRIDAFQNKNPLTPFGGDLGVPIDQVADVPPGGNIALLFDVHASTPQTPSSLTVSKKKPAVIAKPAITPTKKARP